VPTVEVRTSQRECFEIHDLASVSMIVRSISDSVRWMAPPVSTNVRRKPNLILRRAVRDCAPVYEGSLIAGYMESRLNEMTEENRPRAPSN
jgi:hypothetical protein